MKQKSNQIKYEVLHLSTNNIFYNNFINSYDKYCQTKSKFVFLSDTEIKFIEDNKESIRQNKKTILNYLNSSGPYKVIFFHYLSPILVEVLKELNTLNTKIVWVFYGADAFSNKIFEKNIFEPLTADFLKKYKYGLKLNFAFKPWNQFKEIKSYYTKYKRNEFVRNISLDPISKVDYFCNFIEEDYQLIKDRTSLRAQHVPLIMKGRKPIVKKNSSNDILLGNSAAITNNHLDAFWTLKDINLNSRKLIVPLSYAGTHFYKKFIIEKGKYYFGNNFRPILKYLPLDEYNKIIDSCGYVVMNHRRSQAAGNIIDSIFLGKKVFLNNHSSLKSKLDEIGIKNFSTKSIDFLPLSDEIVELNRKKALLFFGEDHVKLIYQDLEKLLLTS